MPATMEERRAVNEPEGIVHKINVDSEGNRFTLEVCNLDDATGLRVLLPDEIDPEGSRRCEHCFRYGEGGG